MLVGARTQTELLVRIFEPTLNKDTRQKEKAVTMKISQALIITVGLPIIWANPCQDSRLGECVCYRNKIENNFNIYCPDTVQTRVTLTLRKEERNLDYNYLNICI